MRLCARDVHVIDSGRFPKADLVLAKQNHWVLRPQSYDDDDDDGGGGGGVTLISTTVLYSQRDAHSIRVYGLRLRNSTYLFLKFLIVNMDSLNGVSHNRGL
jgi:hypothetical protein